MSALNLIVFGEKVEHLDLIEGVVVDLLQMKWKSFIKRSYYRQLLTFVVYFLLSSFVFILRPSAPKHHLSCSNQTDFNFTGMFYSNDTSELLGSPTILHFNDTEELNRRGNTFISSSQRRSIRPSMVRLTNTWQMVDQ